MRAKPSYIKRQFRKVKGGTPPRRKSDRYPIHKKMHRRTLKEKLLREWKRLGKDIESVE